MVERIGGRLLVLILSLSLIPDLAMAAAQSFFNVPFKEVSYSVGIKSFVYFDWVVIGYSLMKVAVPLEAVEVVLKEDVSEISEIYTTLDLVSVDTMTSPDGYLKPEKVIVVVRDKDDLVAWQKFLSRLRRNQEMERKKLLEPVRVLPPK